MSEESAVEILKRASRLWPRIGTLFFFGGEPLLKKRVINRICQTIDNNEISGLATRPSFALVTNATRLNDDAIDLIAKYHIEVNVSVDGPQEINDKTRIDIRGNGTSRLVLKNLQRLRSRGINYHIEATFSKYHLIAGISLMDIMDYFYQEHGIRVLHAPWVSADERDPYYLSESDILAAYEPAIRYSMKNVRQGVPKVLFFVADWLAALHRYNPQMQRPYCPACFYDVAVTSTGDVYPCFMFNGFQNFKIGNVFDDCFFENLNQGVIEAFYESIFAPCNCPPEYQPFHFGCVGADRIAVNSILAKPYCGIQTKLFEAFLEEMGRGREALQHQHPMNKEVSYE